MELPHEWAQMDAQELRHLTATLFAQLTERTADSPNLMSSSVPAKH